MKNRRQIQKKPNKLAAFIPARVSNETVLRMLDRMRRWERRFGRRGRFADNRTKNEAAFSAHEAAIRAAGGFIEDQNRYGDMRLGKATVAYAGCEVIAVYNVIRALSGTDAVSFPELIEAFERDGIVLSGRFGTAPKALRDYLEQQGFHVEMVTEESEFDQFASGYDALILIIYNDRDDIRREIHTIAVEKSGRGLAERRTGSDAADQTGSDAENQTAGDTANQAGSSYTAHNAGRGRAAGPFDSITELIRRISGGRGKGIALIGVSGGTGAAPAEGCV